MIYAAFQREKHINMKTETLKIKFAVESSRSATISIKRFQSVDADWKCEPGTDLSERGIEFNVLNNLFCIT